MWFLLEWWLIKPIRNDLSYWKKCLYKLYRRTLSDENWWRESKLWAFIRKNPTILRIFQHTPGTYPRPPTNSLWRSSFHLGLRGCLGYAPGVCWGSLRTIPSAPETFGRLRDLTPSLMISKIPAVKQQGFNSILMNTYLMHVQDVTVPKNRSTPPRNST